MAKPKNIRDQKYIIAESKDGYRPRGKLLEAWNCQEHEFIVAGPAQCVSGKTKIFNIDTNEYVSIKDLCDNNISPTVMTLYGPKKASIPFRKGIDALYKVSTQDGEEFISTKRHLVLTSSGFSFVESLRRGQPLFVYSQVPSKYNYTIQLKLINDLEFVGFDEYYDLTVPEAGHYFAEGFIHHNTGKTIMSLQRLHLLCCLYPKASAAIIRKTYRSMPSSVIETYLKKVLPDKSLVEIYGGENRVEKITYPNESSIWVAGMDNPDKVLSSERDYIYVNQAEELNLKDWETLLTRATGRAGNVPNPQVFGDCNPSHPAHWIKKREKDGKLKLINTTFRDNPTLFDDEGNITKLGKHTLEILSNLTGARKARLFEGLWAAPEGAIYDIFDENRHVIHSPEINPMWVRVVGIDPVGMLSAAVWLAYDPENEVLIAYREYYESSGRSTPEHVHAIKDITLNEPVIGYCGGGPAEKQARIDWNAAGIPLVEPSTKDVWSQIDRVYQLLNEGALLISEDCPNLISEIGAYHRIMHDNIATDDIENKDQMHLSDALRYAVDFLAGDHLIIKVGSLEMGYVNY